MYKPSKQPEHRDTSGFWDFIEDGLVVFIILYASIFGITFAPVIDDWLKGLLGR